MRLTEYQILSEICWTSQKKSQKRGELMKSVPIEKFFELSKGRVSEIV